MCAQQFCEAGNWVWTVWKRYEVSGTRPEIFFAPFGRGLRVNGGWRETYFWDVCSIVLWGWKLGLDGLETVWGVWNQARSFGNSILNILLFWKISIRRLVPKLYFSRISSRSHQKTAHEGGGGGGGHFPIVKKCQKFLCFLNVWETYTTSNYYSILHTTNSRPEIPLSRPHSQPPLYINTNSGERLTGGGGA